MTASRLAPSALNHHLRANRLPPSTARHRPGPAGILFGAPLPPPARQDLPRRAIWTADSDLRPAPDCTASRRHQFAATLVTRRETPHREFPATTYAARP